VEPFQNHHKIPEQRTGKAWN